MWLADKQERDKAMKKVNYKDNNELDKACTKYWRKAQKVSFDGSDKQDVYNLLDAAERLIRGLSEALVDRNAEAK